MKILLLNETAKNNLLAYLDRNQYIYTVIKNIDTWTVKIDY